MLKHQIKNGVATVTIVNPPVNVITIEMLDAMAYSIAESSGAKVLVLQAEGDVFSAGVDVAEHLEPTAARMIGSFRSVVDALSRFQGIVVAAVDGTALGGGCELVCLCDVVLASDDAEFGQPETQVGVLPPVASVLWSRAMGYNRALELILSGERVSAQEMARAGLVNRVIPAAKFDEEVSQTIDRYRKMSRVVLAHAKQACRIGCGADINSALRQIESLYLNSLMKTKDATEGLNAFIEKRPPEWRDC